jgi:hypothetical protein
MQKGGQERSPGMDDPMCHVLRAGTQMEDSNDLGKGVDGQPEPQHVLRAAQPGAQFIQVEMWEPQMAEETLVQGLSVRARAGQPGGNGGLPVAEDPQGLGKV